MDITFERHRPHFLFWLISSTEIMCQTLPYLLIIDKMTHPVPTFLLRHNLSGGDSAQ